MKRAFTVQSNHAFSLVEVTLALGLAAFSLVAIFGMIPVGLNASQNAAAQTGAVSVLRAVAADLRDVAPVAGANTALTTNVGTVATVATVSPKSSYFGFTVPDGTGATIYVDGGGSPTTQALARYSVFVKTVSPVGTTSRSATQERVVVSWPPQAVNAAGSLESVIALDRN